MRNVLAHAGRQGRRVVAAFIGTAFVQDDAETARTQWRQVADQLRPKVPKLAALMDQAEADVLAFMSFPKDHRPKIHSINPLERLNGEIKRRTDVVGIFPNEGRALRLADRGVGNQRITCGRRQMSVAEQHLDDADVRAILQKMRRKAVPQDMHGDALVEREALESGLGI